MKIPNLYKGLVGMWDFDINSLTSRYLTELAYFKFDGTLDSETGGYSWDSSEAYGYGTDRFSNANSCYENIVDSGYRLTGSTEFIKNYTPLSISFWFKQTSRSSQTSFSSTSVFQIDYGFFLTLLNVVIFPRGPEYTQISFTTSNGIQSTTFPYGEEGLWTHLVISIGAYENDPFKIYLNNDLVYSEPLIGDFNYVPESMYCAPYTYGGFIDDFRFYDKILSDDEVNDLYTFNEKRRNFIDKSLNNNVLLNNGATFTDNKYSEENKALRVYNPSYLESLPLIQNKFNSIVNLITSIRLLLEDFGNGGGVTLLEIQICTIYNANDEVVLRYGFRLISVNGDRIVPYFDFYDINGNLIPLDQGWPDTPGFSSDIFGWGVYHHFSSVLDFVNGTYNVKMADYQWPEKIFTPVVPRFTDKGNYLLIGSNSTQTYNKIDLEYLSIFNENKESVFESFSNLPSNLKISNLNQGLIGRWDFNENSMPEGKYPDRAFIPMRGSGWGEAMVDITGKMTYFDEFSSSSLTNYTSTDRFGNPNNSPTYENANGKVVFHDYLRRKNAMSVSVWIYRSTSGWDDAVILARDGTTYVGPPVYWWVYLNVLTLTLYTDNGNVTLSGGVVNRETWYHVVYSTNGNSGDVVKMYLNGSLVDSDTLPGNLRNEVCRMSFGRRETTTYAWYGTMNDIHLFDRELTYTEIQQLKNDNRVISNFYDKSINNNNLVNVDGIFVDDKWGTENSSIELSITAPLFPLSYSESKIILDKVQSSGILSFICEINFLTDSVFNSARNPILSIKNDTNDNQFYIGGYLTNVIFILALPGGSAWDYSSQIGNKVAITNEWGVLGVVVNFNTHEIKVSINGNDFTTGTLDFSNVDLFSSQSSIGILSGGITAQNELNVRSFHLYDRDITTIEIKKLYETKI